MGNQEIDHYIVSASSPQSAGTPFTTTVTAQDAQGNVALGYTGTVHFTSSDPQAAVPGDYTFVAGDQGAHTFSVTLKTAGTWTIRVNDKGGSQTGNYSIALQRTSNPVGCAALGWTPARCLAARGCCVT